MTSRDSCSLDVNKLGKHEPQRWWSVDDEKMRTLLCKQLKSHQVKLSLAQDPIGTGPTCNNATVKHQKYSKQCHLTQALESPNGTQWYTIIVKGENFPKPANFV